MNRSITAILFLALILSGLFSCSGIRDTDYLKDGFINPPDSAKPGVYWYFMDGSIDRKAITADLESMKSAGIGYVLFLEVNVGVPRGKTDFLSEEWQDMFTHAVRECERLGIRLILGSGPGWAGSGGPWVRPEQSMQHLVAFDTVISGPAVFAGKLTIPAPRKPFFGEESLTPDLKKIRDEWYEDFRVLAFPTPDVAGRIDMIDEKALYYRAPYTSQPGVAPFIRTMANYNEAKGASVSKERIIDISAMMDRDGTLRWNVPPGKWTVMRFGKRNNGAVTRPAPLPGLGFECDKFDTAAFRAHWDAFTGKLLTRVQPKKQKNGGGWTMIHIDSWEMGAQNWSGRFIEEFIKRRGYDPMLFLPVYKGIVVNSKDESERFLWDVRQTSNELIIQNHAGFFRELGRRNGLRLSIEPYDMNPASDLDLGQVADVPMCEFWTDGFGFNSSFSCIEAVSVANVAGKRVVAAEAFTADHREAWKMYPGNMKNQTDWAFAMGINRLIFHTFAHKPHGDQHLPGMTMGPYGVHWDRGQTWWTMSEAYHEYIARCQFVLSQGKTVADILYLAPEGAPHVFRPPSSALEGTEFLPDKRGYSFDGCSPDFFTKYAFLKDRKISFPDGGSYPVMILPDVPAMTPELLSKLDNLIKNGAIVAGYQPVKAPTLNNYPVCDSVVKKQAREMWKGGPNLPETETTRKKYNLGYIYRLARKPVSNASDSWELYPSYEMTVREVLKASGIKEDFISEGNIRYIHKTTGDRDIYFISNRTGRAVSDSCTFRDGTMYAEIWDPATGDIVALDKSILSSDASGISMKVSLQPYESRFIVFYHQPEVKKPKVRSEDPFAGTREILTIAGPWTAEFDTTRGGPGKITLERLTDWTENENDGIRYYSGIATYSCNFNMPGTFSIKDAGNIYLDLGEIHNLAELRLNGQKAGIVWTHPFRVKIKSALRQDNNRLEIKVANLWINRLIGDEHKPWDGIEDGRWPDWLLNDTPRTSGRYTFTTHRFYRKDDPLVKSGLLGPVRIIASE